jgi:DNA mismatch repair protein MutL
VRTRSATDETPNAEPERSGDPGGSTDGPAADGAGTDREVTPRRDERRFAATDQSTLDGSTDAGTDEGFERLPDLRVLGQLEDTYVVAECDEGLVLVDQHAADERVQYERLRGALSGETTTQALVEPVELELTAREAELFDAYTEALSRLGFSADREGRTARVRTVPAALDATLPPELLRDALSECVSGDPGGTVDATVDALLADLACYPAVTGNVSLTEGSVVGLLSALDDCENPYACPHGRPTVIRIDREELADRFERDYPGHGGRRGSE